MPWQSWTALALVAGLLLAIIYDVVAYRLGGNDATISRLLLDVSARYCGFALVLAFLFGVLFGHLFLAQHVYLSP